MTDTTFEQLLMERSLAILNNGQGLQAMVDKILDRRSDPYSAAAELVEQIFKQ